MIAAAVIPGDYVEDDSGVRREVVDVEILRGWVVLHDGHGDALIVPPDREVRAVTPV